MVDDQRSTTDGFVWVFGSPCVEVFLQGAYERFASLSSLGLDLDEVSPPLISDEDVSRSRSFVCLVQIGRVECRVGEYHRDCPLEVSAGAV